MNGNKAKVANYGTSRVIDSNATMSMTGTPIYTAPEILRGERYSFAADVYSFGLTTYAVCDRVRFCSASACGMEKTLLSLKRYLSPFRNKRIYAYTFIHIFIKEV